MSQFYEETISSITGEQTDRIKELALSAAFRRSISGLFSADETTVMLRELETIADREGMRPHFLDLLLAKIVEEIDPGGLGGEELDFDLGEPFDDPGPRGGSDRQSRLPIRPQGHTGAEAEIPDGPENLDLVGEKLEIAQK